MHYLLFSLHQYSLSGAGGAKRPRRKSTTLKYTSDHEEEEEIAPVKKPTHHQQSDAAKATQKLVLVKMNAKPVDKWPVAEYSEMRQRNSYLASKEARCSPRFWNFFQQKIYEDIYTENVNHVAPMHTIDFAHVEKEAEYFADAKAIWTEFGLMRLMNFNHPYNEDIIA